MKAIGAPAPVVCSPADLAAERKAAELVFGWKGLPVYDIASRGTSLSVGADFLGAWASPVYYSRQYGHFRQGRPGVRGQLVHAESRMSLTAGAADRWLPLRPGYGAAVSRGGRERCWMPARSIRTGRCGDIAVCVRARGAARARGRGEIEARRKHRW